MRTREEVIASILVHFPSGNTAKRLEDYRLDLCAIPTDLLDHAVRSVMETWDKGRPPLPGRIRHEYHKLNAARLEEQRKRKEPKPGEYDEDGVYYYGPAEALIALRYVVYHEAWLVDPELAAEYMAEQAELHDKRWETQNYSVIQRGAKVLLDALQSWRSLRFDTFEHARSSKFYPTGEQVHVLGMGIYAAALRSCVLNYGSIEQKVELQEILQQ